MNIITVRTTTREYPVYVGENILKEAERFIDRKGKLVIITDENVAALYLESLKGFLKGREVYTIVLKASEETKNLDTVSHIYHRLCEFGIGRKDTLIAFGGGVVGDITGFAAATYLRGIAYVQIPTTLLSQVDSSIGGKTGVDLAEGKNLVGAFIQPHGVIADTALIKTLEPEQYASGMAEVVKAGFIRDKELVELLEAEESPDMWQLIGRAIKVKKDIVEADEFEKDERMLLNFGHTFGHAIEKLYNFKGITHGAAVAIGMCMVTKTPKVKESLINILNKYHLPTEIDIPVKEIIAAARNDKKSDNEDINLILVDEIGKGYRNRIPFEQLYSMY